jgi:hypothetical protein
MYVARCDFGMIWDGATCTGVRTTRAWNNGTGTFTSTGFLSTTLGVFNTAGLVALVDGGEPYQAAVACDGLTDHGHTDWYLPSTSELHVIYVKLVDGTPQNNSPNPVVPGFAVASSYWSSSEWGTPAGFSRYFNDGSQGAGSKAAAFYVRCVRKD